jgi:hypothetical protein
MRGIRLLLFVPLFVYATPLVWAWGFSPKVSITAKVAPPYYLGSSVKRIVVVDKAGKGTTGGIMPSTTDLGRCRLIGGMLVSSLRRFKTMTASATQTPMGLADFDSSNARAGELRNQFPADAYAEVTNCECVNASEGSRETKDLKYKPACRGTVHLVNGRDGSEIASFVTNATITTQIFTFEDLDTAETNSLWAAGEEAARMISPSTTQISIDLENNVPGEKDALNAVKQKNYQAARAIWESALAANSASAALNFNLGAVSEASGDLEAARKYYREAVRLAPTESKYKDTFMEFYKRASDAETLARGQARFP